MLAVLGFLGLLAYAPRNRSETWTNVLCASLRGLNRTLSARTESIGLGARFQNQIAWRGGGAPELGKTAGFDDFPQFRFAGLGSQSQTDFLTQRRRFTHHGRRCIKKCDPEGFAVQRLPNVLTEPILAFISRETRRRIRTQAHARELGSVCFTPRRVR